MELLYGCTENARCVCVRERRETKERVKVKDQERGGKQVSFLGARGKSVLLLLQHYIQRACTVPMSEKGCRGEIGSDLFHRR